MAILGVTRRQNPLATSPSASTIRRVIRRSLRPVEQPFRAFRSTALTRRVRRRSTQSTSPAKESGDGTTLRASAQYLARPTPSPAASSLQEAAEVSVSFIRDRSIRTASRAPGTASINRILFSTAPSITACRGTTRAGMCRIFLPTLIPDRLPNLLHIQQIRISGVEFLRRHKFCGASINGVTALLGQSEHTRIGLLNFPLYDLAHGLRGYNGSKPPLRAITDGDNFYSGHVGYSPAAGLGTLDVANFDAYLHSLQD